MNRGDSEVSTYMWPTLVHNFTYKYLRKVFIPPGLEEFTINYISNYSAVLSNPRLF